MPFWPVFVLAIVELYCGGYAVLSTFRASERAWRKARLAVGGMGLLWLLQGVSVLLLEVQLGVTGPDALVVAFLIGAGGVGILAFTARRWRDERLWARIGQLMHRITHPVRKEPPPAPAFVPGWPAGSDRRPTLGEGLPSDPIRRLLPDGRTLLVAPFSDDGDWYARVEGDSPEEIVGWPLASTLASLLGYDVANGEWPAWIDEAAREVVGEVRARGVATQKDPVAPSTDTPADHRWRRVISSHQGG